MKSRLLFAGLLVALPALVSAGGTASAAPTAGAVHLSVSTCTHTSSGTCIRGGQFCPQASFNRSGYDAAGRRYVCKGSRVHPHWMKP